MNQKKNKRQNSHYDYLLYKDLDNFFRLESQRQKIHVCVNDIDETRT